MPVKGNGQITNKELTLNDYNEISIVGPGVLVYENKTDAAPYLKIETDNNIMPLVEISSENGVLVIKPQKNINPSSINIYTNSTALAKINSTGSANITIKGEVNTSSLDLGVTGSGKITGENIICQKFRANVVGSGNVKISGTASDIKSTVLGSGSIDVNEMPAQEANCKITGSGSSFVNISENLRAEILGSGEVKYQGTPLIESSVVGSGKVSSIN